MAGRIVVFGATGYTGRLTAEALVERGARPLLAARNVERLRELGDELGGLEIAVADVSKPRSVRELVEQGDVLVSTVGPFARWGDPAAEAAIEAGAHYLDSNGEPAFIRRVFDEYRATSVGEVYLLDPAEMVRYYGSGADELHMAFNFAFLWSRWGADAGRSRRGLSAD